MEEIKSKANYCLNCVTKPCSNKGCPLNNNIPGFIKAIKEENYKQAYEILSETTVLESVCGRICPHTKQCQGSCVRGIKGQPVSIGELEAFVGDIAIKEGYKFAEINNENKNKKIAIVGGGPAGLTASAFLLKKGYSVTIFEKYDYLGGLLVHGIPEFRLPKKIVKDTIQKILNLGLQVEYNKELGKNFTLQELEDKFDAVFDLLKEEENRGKIPLFAGINKMRFSSVVVPGDVLRMKVQFKRMIGGICIAGCEAYVDDKKVAYGEIFCALQDVE